MNFLENKKLPLSRQWWHEGGKFISRRFLCNLFCTLGKIVPSAPRRVGRIVLSSRSIPWYNEHI
nr:MAG TPA: hypothetical protein [Caudoviricetes sp.]